jgi:hypothetical protein
MVAVEGWKIFHGRRFRYSPTGKSEQREDAEEATAIHCPLTK